MLFVGIGVAFLIGRIMPESPSHHKSFPDYLISILISVLIWEGNLRIDHWLNKRLPWLKRPKLRLLSQFLIAMVYSSLALLIPMRLYNDLVCIIPPDREFMLTLVSLALGLLVSVILLTFEVSTQFFQNWKSSLIEAEHYKTENVRAQLQNLKNQVNPHFLFNNLSVLTSLVYKDQDKAAEFINQLSKVYRYLLDSHEKELVLLETELEFIHSYLFLLQIRFDKNLQFDIQVNSESLKLHLPPMALQILVENVIKHNEVSDEHPLNISIRGMSDRLEVRNKLQRRSHIENTSGTGLRNIRERYRFFTQREVKVYEKPNEFIVELPLLSEK